MFPKVRRPTPLISAGQDPFHTSTKRLCDCGCFVILSDCWKMLDRTALLSALCFISLTNSPPSEDSPALNEARSSGALTRDDRKIKTC